MSVTLIMLADESWMDSGACAGAGEELFFPERGEAIDQARRVCLACPVREECLDYALRNGERYGVWGATSERERRKLRKQYAEGRPLKLPAKALPKVTVSRVRTAHGAAIRELFTDGGWHTTDEFAELIAPLLAVPLWRAREIAQTTLHNMRRREPVELREPGRWRMVAS